MKDKRINHENAFRILALFLFALILIPFLCLSTWFTLWELSKWQAYQAVLPLVVEQCHIENPYLENWYYANDMGEYFSGDLIQEGLRVSCENYSFDVSSAAWQCTCTERD